jgi:hypothetical protein
MELEYPERFTVETTPAALAKWTGTISELLELAVSVHNTGTAVKSTGEPMAWSDVIALIERIFGLKIPRPYERKSKLFNRKKDETPFLHKLITVFKTEIEKYYR